MPERPRAVFIGTPTLLWLREYSLATGALLKGVTNGQVVITSERDPATTIATLPMIEAAAPNTGSYFATVPFDQAGLTEGLPLLLTFTISAGTGLELEIRSQAVAVYRKDRGRTQS